MRPSSTKLAGWTVVTTALGLGFAACRGGHPVATAPAPDSAKCAPVTVRDPAMEQKAARLQLRVMERETQIEDLQGQLDDARQEVVRAMAKLQTLASRAEAASGIAEAEIAVQGLQAPEGSPASADVSQARRLLNMSSGEFDKQNYGGALYLATQAKAVAGAARGRLGDQQTTLRPGETPFALPLHLLTTGKSNVREGPGTDFKVVYTLESGVAVTAYSYADTWVRIADDSGRAGWVFYNLVAKRP